MLTQARLKEVISYDPETGDFTWLVRQGRAVAGLIAGRVSSNGYVGIQVDGRRYLAHRLAWFYVTGEWPQALVDHEDRNKRNNRFANLREASHSQNQANRGLNAGTALRVKGVCRMKANLAKPYRATFKGRGIGYFATIEEANAAYMAAATKHFGEFARAA